MADWGGGVNAGLYVAKGSKHIMSANDARVLFSLCRLVGKKTRSSHLWHVSAYLYSMYFNICPCICLSVCVCTQ